MAQEASLPPPPPVPGNGGELPDQIPLRPALVPQPAAHEGADSTDSGDGGSSGRTDDTSPATLDRLLVVAVLTPAQAAHVAAEVLTTAATIGQGRRTDVRVTPPVITRDGDVQATAATDGTAGVVVDDVLARLVDSARRLPAHPRPHQVALLRRLEEVADSSYEPTARALMLHSALEEALGPDSSTRLAKELAHLVAALAQVADSTRAEVTPMRVRSASPRPAPRPAATEPRRQDGAGVRPPAPAVRRDLGGRRPRGPGVRTAAVVLLGLVVLVGGYLALNRPGSGTGRGDQAAGPRAATPTAKPHHRSATHHRSVVPVLAPAKAAPVTGVALQRSGPCRPGGSCPVRVTVSLTPATVSQTVGWRVGVVHACTRKVTWSAPAAVTAQPGWTRVYAGSVVRIPSGYPVALVAVTGSPVRAQSPAVGLTTSTPRC